MRRLFLNIFFFFWPRRRVSAAVVAQRPFSGRGFRRWRTLTEGGRDAQWARFTGAEDYLHSDDFLLIIDMDVDVATLGGRWGVSNWFAEGWKMSLLWYYHSPFFFKSFYLFLETFFSHFSAPKLPIKLLIAIRVKFELFKSYLSIWLYHVEMTRNALNSIKIPIQ